MKARRVLFWALLIIFIGFIAARALYFPYDEERLFRAIPANATYVSEHRNIAGRWATFAKNPLTMSLFVSCGVASNNADKVADDPGTVALIRRFAAKNTVIAYVPSLGPAGNPAFDGVGTPAWILVSWVGTEGQFVRWGFYSALLKDFRKVDAGGGRTVWMLEKGDTKSDERLSLAVAEGVLVACYSRQADGARYIVDRIESRADLASDLRDALESRRAGKPDNAVMDRGWTRWRVTGKGLPATLRAEYVLSAHDQNGTAGRAWGDSLLPPAAGVLNKDAGVGELERILGDAPEAIVAVPAQYVETLLSERTVPQVFRDVWRLLKPVAAENGPAALCLCGGEFSGRILGFKVPATLFAVKVNDGGKVSEMVAGALDTLNAKYRWGLIPRRDEVEGQAVVVLESSLRGIYSSLRSEEKPAIMIQGDWFILSSNKDTLRKILAGSRLRGEAGGEKEAMKPRWSRDLVGRDCGAYTWWDLESAGKALRNAMAVYSLVLKLQSAPGSEETLRALDSGRAWLDCIRPLRTCAFWLNSSGSKFDLQFRLGEVSREGAAKTP